MTLLRSRTAPAEATLVSSPSVAKALSDWDQRVAQAREEGRRAGLAEAERRITAAEQRAAQAEQTAENRQQQRQQEFLGRFDPVLKAITAAAAQLDPLQKLLIKESEAECVRLALIIAAVILRRDLDTDPAWMDRVAAAALAEIPDRRVVSIRMHPTDADSLRERMQTLIGSIPGLEQLEISGDAALARGACILASRGSRLDASLAGCWERMAQRLLDAAPTSDPSIATWPGDPPAGGTP